MSVLCKFSLTWTLDGGGWLEPRPSQLTAENDPITTVKEAWRVRKVSPPTGIRSLKSTARRESLHHLCYSGPEDRSTH